MGTGHLIAVVLNGEYKVAQYGQFDGYPSGQGQTVVDFIRDSDMRAFADRVGKLKQLSESEIKAKWQECGGTADGQFSCDAHDCFRKRYPWLTREAGANVLHAIRDGEADSIRLATEFAADSLFCEYAYVLDLDRQALEVYRGFNESPLTEADRFYFLEPLATGEYHPVKLMSSFPFSALDDDTVGLMEPETTEAA